MPISPKQIMEELNLKESAKVNELCQLFDRELDKQYTGNNNVTFDVSGSGITESVERKIVQMYKDSGWTVIAFLPKYNWKDGCYYEVTIKA